MSALKLDFLQIMHERGFIHQTTNEAGLKEALKSPITAYIGFDCTAESLHVGSLMQIMILYWLQYCGHNPIVLMGGGTTKVGDPSGKDESRKMLTEDQILSNMDGIKTVFSKYITFSDRGGNAIMVNNDAWLKDIHYLDFLRDYGRHFSVNRMLSMDSVKMRLEREQNLSFLEFNYMILQAYDFVELNRRFGCQLQIGGSDQWGNIVNGVELKRRLDVERIANKEITKGTDLFGLTTPLITTASGTKMGKTEGGAIWLNADMCSPYDYWQFWRNTEDADVGRFLRFFTTFPLDQIKELEKLSGAEINKAKIVLANEATKLCHGEEAAVKAEETAKMTFLQGGIGEDLKTFFVEESLLAAGVPAYELFFMTGLQESKGAAKKLIQGGGGRINNDKITDPAMIINKTHLVENVIKLSAGKKQHLLVKTG